MKAENKSHIYTNLEVGELLFELLIRHNGRVAFKDFNKNLKYGAGFFSPKKKEHLVKEMFFLNNAMIVFCVNQAFDDTSQIKEVIDTYLIKTSLICDTFEESDADMRDTYELRMQDYYKNLHSNDPALTASLSFLNNLFRKPEFNAMRQFFLTTSIGSFIITTIEMLQDLPVKR